MQDGYIDVVDGLPTPQIAKQVREPPSGNVSGRVLRPDGRCVLASVAGSTPIISAWADGRRRPALAQRLAPYQSVSVAEKAERWLGEEAACRG
jgi:hypothetical protein